MDIKRPFDTIPVHMHPDMRMAGSVLAALIVVTALLIGVYVINIRAERAVLSGDSAFVFSVTTPDSHAASQAKTTQSARTAAKAVLPTHSAEKPVDAVAPAPAHAAVPVADPVAAVSSEIYTQTEHGPLPMRRGDGVTAYSTFKAAAIAAPANVPQMAVILTGFGLSTTQSRAAIDALPPGVTLGLTPYIGNDMIAVLDNARSKGHEIWLDAPIADSTALQDAGPYAIDPGAANPAMQTQFLNAMGRGRDYVGLLIPASLPDQAANAIAGERGLAVAALPPVTAPSDTTPEALTAYILSNQKSGTRVVTLPLSRLSVNVLGDMVKTQKIAITPLSAFVKEAAAPVTSPSIATPVTPTTPPNTAPSNNDLAPAHAP
ncbi:MAG: divergent polysaccharide deacetylase family protein [Pseudomonadota bacterium]